MKIFNNRIAKMSAIPKNPLFPNPLFPNPLLPNPLLPKTPVLDNQNFHFCTVKSHTYESQDNDMSRKYNRIIDDAVMEVSIEKSR